MLQSHMSITIPSPCRFIITLSTIMRGGGGDNLPKSSPSRPHSPRGSHGIYKHISFYWYPTKNQNLTPPRPKN